MHLRKLALLALGLAILAAAPSTFAQKSSSKGGKNNGPPPAPVVVTPLRAVREAPQGEYTGLIQPANKAMLSSDVAGRLVKLLKKVGDPVAEGEVLAILENPTMELDLAVLQARMKETQAQAVLSEQQQNRIVSLYRKKLTSAQKFEDGKAKSGVMKAKLELDRVQVERLKELLKRMVIRSPIEGQVISTDLEIGQWITPNKPIFEIYNYRQYEVMVGIPGRFLTSVPDKGRVVVFVSEIGKRLNGNIRSVVRHVDRSTGNFTMRIEIDNPSRAHLSGMLARVRLPLSKTRVLLTVPRDAIVRKGKRIYVVLVIDGKAKIVPVSVQGNLGDNVVVQELTPKAWKGGQGKAGKNGRPVKFLKPGQSVVIRGNERLFPGTPVRIAENFPSQSGRKL